MKRKRHIAAATATLAIVAAFSGAAQADEAENSVKVGYARVNFAIKSGDLTGPPGTTPPGIGIGAESLDIFAISYERRLSPNWAVQLQVGIPPTITAFGTGVAESVGTVAKARIWFPTVLALYTFTNLPVIRPYIGVGATYTFFTEEESSQAYTAAVQGSSSSIGLKSSLGPYIRLGFEYPINERWGINMDYSTYRLKTKATIGTQTPGFGEITRHIDINDSPRIFGLTVNYKF